MKYWRGYLTAGILAAVTWALTRLAKTYSELLDMIYPYISRILQNTLAGWSGSVSFCLWQVLLVFLVVVVLATLVLMIVCKWNPIRWTGWVAAAVSLVVLLNTALFGLNRYAGPIAEDIHLDNGTYTLSQLVDAAAYYRDQANTLANKVSRDASGDVTGDSFETLTADAGEGFRYLTYERGFSLFAGTTQPVKKLEWQIPFLTSRHELGMTVGITGEACVNTNVPQVLLPYAICREMADRMCISVPRDMDFAGVLAARFHSAPAFQYAGYLMAYRFTVQTLENVSGSAAKTMLDGVRSGENANLSHDLSVADGFLSATDDVQVTGEVGRLLVNWYLQETVLPDQSKEENTFDPFDKNQVDLSGIANAGAAND